MRCFKLCPEISAWKNGPRLPSLEPFGSSSRPIQAAAPPCEARFDAPSLGCARRDCAVRRACRCCCISTLRILHLADMVADALPRRSDTPWQADIGDPIRGAACEPAASPEAMSALAAAAWQFQGARCLATAARGRGAGRPGVPWPDVRPMRDSGCSRCGVLGRVVSRRVISLRIRSSH